MRLLRQVPKNPAGSDCPSRPRTLVRWGLYAALLAFGAGAPAGAAEASIETVVSAILHPPQTSRVSLSPNGRYLAYNLDEPGGRSSVAILDLESPDRRPWMAAPLTPVGYSRTATSKSSSRASWNSAMPPLTRADTVLSAVSNLT